MQYRNDKGTNCQNFTNYSEEDNVSKVYIDNSTWCWLTGVVLANVMMQPTVVYILLLKSLLVIH